MENLIEINECSGMHEFRKESRSTEELLRNGFIIIDKWSGPTSRDVAGILKNILGLKKAGHPGTLDPPATGMLPIMLENATKVIPALQGQDKEYIAVIHLHKDAETEIIRKKLAEFIGVNKQMPPRRSAVARRVRERKIHEIELLDKNGRNICVRIKCEAGTYVRVIAHDLGKKLGFGAHLKELRRTAVAEFKEENMVQMKDVQEAFRKYKNGDDSELRKIIRPVEEAVGHLKKIVIKNTAIKNVLNGSPVFSSGLCSASSNIRKGDMVAIMSLGGELIALGTAKMNVYEMKKHGTAVKTDRVVMERENRFKYL